MGGRDILRLVVVCVYVVCVCVRERDIKVYFTKINSRNRPLTFTGRLLIAPPAIFPAGSCQSSLHVVSEITAKGYSIQATVGMETGLQCAMLQWVKGRAADC